MAAGKGSVERLADRWMPSKMRPLWERVRGSSIGYRIAHGAFWSTAGVGIAQVLMLLVSIVVARVLGREQFGEYGIVMSTVGMFSVLAGFGLGTTATKFVAEYRTLDPERAGRIIAMSSLVALTIGAVASLVLLIIAPWLAATSLAAPHLSAMIRIGAVLVFFSAINSAQIGALAGFEAFRAMARLNLLGGLITFLLVLWGIFSWGLKGVLAGQAAAAAVSCVLATFALQSQAKRFGIPQRFSGCWSERSVLLSFSVPAILAGVLVSPVAWACSAMLVNQPNGYGEMGIFNAANSWQKAILFVPNCIGAIALPLLSQLHGAEERGDYRKALWYNVLLNGAAAFGAFVVIALCSKLIMATYGGSFVSGYPVLILLGISSVLISVGTVIGNALASTGQMWKAFWVNGAWGVVTLALAAVLVPRYGAIGLAASSTGGYLLHFCLQAYIARRIHR